ncbi:tetratricopeptide repeat protein [Pseudonocardia acidicola]|uniref:Tetratricopeptide repeat protein n=1 Tax=Pseudonocardia acidicola TaxID=2724939 RepID=A0ABX1SIH8_9PSEU|nr:tetratricopeptide repeat protein [Pseudonocardia acidicola]NMI00613.1 tetratricopeptide repeat protein [Pseudonocardia acidicola]
MTGPAPDVDLSLRIDAPVEVAVQIGRLVLEPGVPAPSPPAPVTGPLIGRAAALAALDALAAADRRPPGVLLYGPAGIGASSLVLGFAARHGPTFPGGVLLAHLDDAGADPGPPLRRLLLDLGLTDADIPARTTDRTALYRSLLAARPALVLLEDARSAEQVRALLPGGGSFAITTARRALPGLAVDDVASQPVHGLHHCSATDLLGSHADRPAWRDPDRFAAVVRRCQGSPLALLLIACGPATTASPEEVLAALGPAGPVDPARAAVTAARVALAATPPQARDLLGVAVAAGLVDLGARTLAALTEREPAATGELLEELARRRLLTPVPGAAGRFTVPDPVRRALPAAGSGAAQRYLDLTTARSAADPTGWFDAEQRNLLARATAAARAQDRDTLGALAGAAAAPADVAWIVARAAAETAAAGDDASEAAIRLRAASIHRRGGAWGDALREAARALELAERLGDRRIGGHATRIVADVLAGRGEPAAAERMYLTARDLLAGCDPEQHAHAVRGLGQVHRRQGRIAEALVDLRAALTAYRRLGHRSGLAATWQDVAEAEWERGHRPEAIAGYRAALASLAGDGDRLAQRWATLAGGGRLQVGAGPGEAAAELAGRALAGAVGDGAAARAIRALAALGEGPADRSGTQLLALCALAAESGPGPAPG